MTVYDVFSSLKIERFLTSSNFSWFYELVFCFLWAFSGVLVNTFYRQIIYGIDIYHQSSGKPSRLTKNQDLWEKLFQPGKSVKIGASNEPCQIYMKIFDATVTLGSKNRAYNRTPIQDLKDELDRLSGKKNCNVRESNPGLPRGRREFYHWTNVAWFCSY